MQYDRKYLIFPRTTKIIAVMRLSEKKKHLKTLGNKQVTVLVKKKAYDVKDINYL